MKDISIMYVVQSFLFHKNFSVFEILYVVLQLQFCLMYVPVMCS